MGKPLVEALVIRTLPNTEDKRIQDYSGTNPPYLDENLATYLVELGVQHLLVDLPSVDKEVDGGALAFHRQFWQVDGPLPLRKTATITELIYVPSSVKDGLYDVYIAPALWKLDAAPSRIWLESNL
jgi:kynurenine formamidase